jgi:hypothetical protein
MAKPSDRLFVLIATRSNPSFRIRPVGGRRTPLPGLSRTPTASRAYGRRRCWPSSLRRVCRRTPGTVCTVSSLRPRRASLSPEKNPPRGNSYSQACDHQHQERIAGWSRRESGIQHQDSVHRLEIERSVAWGRTFPYPGLSAGQRAATILHSLDMFSICPRLLCTPDVRLWFCLCCGGSCQ